MAEKSTIARPYAEAIFELAKQQENLEGWSETLSLFEMVASDKQMIRVLDNPKITPQQKITIFNAIGEEKADKADNLISLLIENNRMHVIKEINALFTQLKLAHEAIMPVNVVSAYTIDDAQLETLKAQLSQSFDQRIRLDVEVDASIIGGVIIKAGDKVIDASVKGHLNKMASAMLG